MAVLDNAALRSSPKGGSHPDPALDARPGEPLMQLAIAVVQQALTDVGVVIRDEGGVQLRANIDRCTPEYRDAYAFWHDAYPGTAWARSRAHWLQLAGIDEAAATHALKRFDIPPPEQRKHDLTQAQKVLLHALPETFANDDLPPNLQRRWHTHRDCLLDTGKVTLTPERKYAKC